MRDLAGILARASKVLGDPMPSYVTEQPPETWGPRQSISDEVAMEKWNEFASGFEKKHGRKLRQNEIDVLGQLDKTPSERLYKFFPEIYETLTGTKPVSDQDFTDPGFLANLASQEVPWWNVPAKMAQTGAQIIAPGQPILGRVQAAAKSLAAPVIPAAVQDIGQKVMASTAQAGEAAVAAPEGMAIPKAFEAAVGAFKGEHKGSEAMKALLDADPEFRENIRIKSAALPDSLLKMLSDVDDPEEAVLNMAFDLQNLTVGYTGAKIGAKLGAKGARLLADIGGDAKKALLKIAENATERWTPALERMQRAPVGGRGMEGGVGPRKPKFVPKTAAEIDAAQAAYMKETMKKPRVKKPSETLRTPEEVKAAAQKQIAEAEGRAAGTQIIPPEEIQKALEKPTVGKTSEVREPDNPKAKHPVRYEVVELSDIVGSHTKDLKENPEYTLKALQNRDRTRMAGKETMDKYVREFDPDELLNDGGLPDHGSPILGDADQMAEGGNGRRIMLERVADGENPEGWKSYQDKLKVKAVEVGIDPKSFEHMKRPVLIRRRTAPMSEAERIRFAEATNKSAAAPRSAVEVAKSDAAKVNPELFADFQTGEGSIEDAITSQRNAGVIRQYLEQFTPEERATFQSAKGEISQEGVRKIKNAIFAAGYGEKNGGWLVNKFLDDAEETARNVGKALQGTAGRVAELESAVKLGMKDAKYGIAEDLSKATRKFIENRDAGISYDAYMKQAQIGERELTPAQEKILGKMEEFKRSPQRLQEFIKNYIDEALKTDAPGQKGMFGEVNTTTKDALVEKASRAEAKAHLEATGGMTPEIEKANEAASKAIREHAEVTQRFREGKAKDEEFLASRKKQDAALKEYDKARGEAPPEPKPEKKPKRTPKKKVVAEEPKVEVAPAKPKAPKSKAAKLREQAALAKEAAAEAESKGNIAARDRMLENSAKRTAEAEAIEPPMPQPDQKAFIDGKVEEARKAGTLDALAKKYMGDDVVDKYARRRIAEVGNTKEELAKAAERHAAQTAAQPNLEPPKKVAAPKEKPPAVVNISEDGKTATIRAADGSTKQIPADQIPDAATIDIGGEKSAPLDLNQPKKPGAAGTGGGAAAPPPAPPAKPPSPGPGGGPGPGQKPAGLRPALPTEAGEAAYQAAKAGVQPKGVIQKFKDWLTDIKHSFRWNKNLPEEARFAETKNAMITWQKKRGQSQHGALKDAERILEPLKGDADLVDLAGAKIIADDLRHRASLGHVLPFEMTPESLRKWAAEVDANVAKTPAVAEAIKRRKEVMDGLRGRITKSAEDAGLSLGERFTNPDYYHHMVLEMEAMDRILNEGSGKGVKAPVMRGQYRKAVGSEKAISTNWLQSDLKVMANMREDADTLDFLVDLNKRHGIADKLRNEAKIQNKRNFVKKLADEYGADAAEEIQKGFRTRIAIGKDRLVKAIEKGGSVDGWGGEADLLDVFEKEVKGEIVEYHDIALDKGEFFQMLSDAAQQTDDVGNAAKQILKAVTDRQRLMKEVLGKDALTFKDLIPADHLPYQIVDGNVLYSASTIQDHLAKQLINGHLEQLGITKSDLKAKLVLGPERDVWVLPKEVVATLEDLRKPLPGDNILHKFVRGMKVLWLQGPHRYPLYRFRNLIGDIDKTLGGNMKAILRVPEAMREIWQDLPAIFGKGDFKSQRLAEFSERGGFDAGALWQELGDVNAQKVFNKKTIGELMGQKPERGVAAFFRKLRDGYFGGIQSVDRVIEGFLRYANYIEFERQMKARGGVPESFAASRREHVMALGDVRDRAYKMSNELIGAYDSVSAATRWMSKNIFPFARWTAVNSSAYARMIANTAQDMKLAIKTGEHLGAKTAQSAYILGRTAIGFGGLWAATTAYNYLFHRDEEKDLSTYDRSRPHIILGRNSDRSIRVISGLGSFGDFVKWFGLNNALPYTDDLVAGRMGFKEYAKLMASAPINEGVNMIGPHIKMPIEMLTRREYYPDVFHARPMNERMRYLARTTGFEHEFDIVTGRPHRGILDAVTGTFWKTVEPGEGAYSDIQGMKGRFLEAKDKPRDAHLRSEKGMALYFSRLAKSYDDPAGEKKWREEYFKLGGTTEQMSESLKNLHPLAGMNANERAAFLKTLDKQGKDRLQEAIRYYVEVMLGRGKPGGKSPDTLRRADEVLKRLEPAGAGR